MPEGASYIDQLTPATPAGTAPVAEGDDELRQLKQVLQNTFPDVAGMALPVNRLLAVAHDNTAAFTVSESDARHAVLRITGALTAARDVILPTSRTKFYLVINATTGGFGITARTAAGAGVTVAPGTGEIVYCNGTDMLAAGLPSLGRSNTFTGAQAAPSLLLGAATGGDQGAGTLNAQGLYVNGKHIAYEEGTFTPRIIGLTTEGVGTYSTQVGRYTRIGDRVSIYMTIIWSAHTGTGVMRIEGLPFASLMSEPLSIYNQNITMAAADHYMPAAYVSATQCGLRSVPVGGGGVVNLNIDTSGQFMLSGTYEVS